MRKELRNRKSLWSEVIRKIFIKPGLEGEQDFSKVSGEDERMGITRVDEKAHSKCTQLHFRAKVQVGVYEIRFQNITRNQSNLMEQKVKLNYI